MRKFLISAFKLFVF